MNRLPNKAAPLVAIIGETASGKSALAMQLAQQLNGEIVAADSRTLYSGMDIGTAKPSPQDRQLVPHHLLDVSQPDKPLTAADYKRLADKAIVDVTQRGKLPILVGGTGLYIDAVIFDFQFRHPADPIRRAELEKLDVSQMQHQLIERGISLPRNSQNPRHLIRTIETNGELPPITIPRPATLVIGLRVDIGVLQARIRARVEDMVAQGLVAEANNLALLYGWDSVVLQTTSYKAMREYLEGRVTLEEAKELFMQYDLRLAKRQRAWFKRNKSIQWFHAPVNTIDVVDLVTTTMNNYHFNPDV